MTKELWLMTALLLAGRLSPFWLAGGMSLAQESRGQQNEPPPVAAQATPDVPDENSRFHPRYPRYEVRTADVLELHFAPAAEFNQTVTVQPDGFVYLREVGSIHVEGKTVPELKEIFTAAYQKILRDPVISIVLKDFYKPHFFVAGEVERSGQYELRGEITASRAIAMAGGFNDKAKHSEALLIRRVSKDWAEVKKVNLKEIYAGKVQEDIRIRPDDLLFVPKNRISKIKPFLPVPSIGTYLGIPF